MRLTRPALSGRIAQARRAMTDCRLCPHNCHVNRFTQPSDGLCHLAASANFFAEFVHWGEEDFLIPVYVIYFSGCSLRCGFCSVGQHIGHPEKDQFFNARAMAQRFCEEFRKGVTRLEFVGGEPAINILPALEILRYVPVEIEVVLNTNLYLRPEGRDLWRDVADWYLVDYKFGNDLCARHLARANDYLAVLQTNLLALQGKEKIIIRHLVMPGHLACCTRPTIDWVKRWLLEVPFNLMLGYQPPGKRSGNNFLQRLITPRESSEAVDYARQHLSGRLWIDGNKVENSEQRQRAEVNTLGYCSSTHITSF